MRIRVKICGVTRLRDAEAAVEAGADALGFVFWDGSPRRVTVADARRISLAMPPWVARVGVFVNEPRPVLLAAARDARLTAAQLHGEEDPQYAASLDLDWYRAFKVGAPGDVEPVSAAIGRFGSRLFMLDTRGGPAPGGTGRRFDWGLAAEIGRRAAARERARMILAGGLTPHNVTQAIRIVAASGLWGVDVSSGVESVPGLKDISRVRRFIEAVRSAA